jgi:hypothetical protein
MQFALGKRKENDREVARQEGGFGNSTAVRVMQLVRLSFQVLQFLKIKLWSHKQLEKRRPAF